MNKDFRSVRESAREEEPRRPTMAEIEEALERHDRKHEEFVAKLRERLDNFDDEASRSSRGFTHMEPIPSDYGGNIRVYESSAAEHPSIWARVVCPANLNEPDGPTIEAVVHLPIEGAQLLHKQLGHLVEGHYQVQDES